MRRLKEQHKAEAGALPRAHPAQSGTRQAASYFEQGTIHLLCSLPQLTLWPTAVSWTPLQQASSIKDNAQSGASLDFSVGSNSTHTACCLLRLLKTQVSQAGHGYRSLDVCQSSHCFQYLLVLSWFPVGTVMFQK
jgi:hypothetical protein